MSVWGKTYLQGGTDDWLPLQVHLADVMSVAGHVWDEWAGDHLRWILAQDAGGEESARALLVFLAGVHDIGKATPGFALKSGERASAMEDAGLAMPYGRNREWTRAYGHNVLGQVIVEGMLRSRGWSPEDAQRLGFVVSCHHGHAPSPMDLHMHRGAVEALGITQDWARVREEILGFVLRVSRAERYLAPDGPWARVSRRAQILLLGLLVVSDRVASDPWSFPLIGADEQRPADMEGRARIGWTRSRLPTPWQPRDPGLDADEWVRQWTGKPGARPIQREAIDVARTAEPGLMIIEAPMGEGKTEAGILAAVALADRVGASGISVFLPTMATANAIFDRTLDIVRRSRPDHAVSTFLAHSRRDLDASFSRLPRTRREDDALIVSHPWLSLRTGQGVLSDLVIGTVDQALSGALQSRHTALRHVGMARSVMVIDEIHAYDVHMGVFLESLLRWAGQYRVPVVAMSATLTASGRRALVGAYRDGLRGYRCDVDTEADAAPSPSLITSVGGDGAVLHRAIERSGRRGAVRVVLDEDDDAALVALLGDRLREGGCAAVVRNTVRRAQGTYRALESAFPGEVTLIHSRFLCADRAANEDRVVSALGEGGARPGRRIVVATQVIEQSLDVDFDLMVTDLAPWDLVLQRAGRLHRHASTARPAPLSDAELHIVADWGATPVVAPRGSERVYSDYSLLRAALVARGLHGAIRLPDDIPVQVALAYEGDGDVPPGWEGCVARARTDNEERERVRRNSARMMCGLPPVPASVEHARRQAARTLEGWDERGSGAGGQRPGVRDGMDSIEVVWLVDGLPPGWVRVGEGEHLGRDDLAAGRVPTSETLTACRRLTVPIPGWASAAIAARSRGWWRDGQRGAPAWASSVHVVDARATSATRSEYGFVDDRGMPRTAVYDRELGLSIL